MWNWLFGRKLEDALSETKRVRIKGIRFTIKKIDVLNYLNGSKVLFQVYDTYKLNKQDNLPDEVSEKKIKEHYSHVLVSGVVNPKLSLKKTDGAVCVDDLFSDWNLVNELYQHIIAFTYGKKKVSRSF